VLRGELEDPAAAGELEAWLGGLITGALGRALDDIPDVLVEIAPLPDELRPALYAAVDCAVALPGAQARQWALEAMACGVPVVATDADAAGVVSSATGFPAGAGDLAATLGAAAADPVETGRRGAAARAALVARVL
jgi:glycosyltransferase involved in cell wall biosynthesis